MADMWTDDRIAAALGGIASRLDLPDVVAPWTIEDRPRAHPDHRRRALLVAAIVVAVALLVALAVAPVREAVARWLGIGSTSIERVPSLSPEPGALPSFLAGSRAITESEATAVLGRPLPGVGVLGPPTSIARPPEGGVVLAWDDGRVSLWLHRTEDTPMLIKKIVASGTKAQRVPGLGDASLAIEGAHLFVSPVRTVGASSTVLWAVGNLEHRLEGDLPIDELVRIARSVDG